MADVFATLWSLLIRKKTFCLPIEISRTTKEVIPKVLTEIAAYLQLINLKNTQLAKVNKLREQAQLAPIL